MFLAAGFIRVEHEDHFTLTTVPEHEHHWAMLHAVAHGVVEDESPDASVAFSALAER
jgi:hypothetical protein